MKFFLNDVWHSWVLKCYPCLFLFKQVFGCVLIGFGAWTLIKYGDFVTITQSIPYATGSKVMIAAGVLIAIIAFLGCCGAWKENRCMLVIVSDCQGLIQIISCLC